MRECMVKNCNNESTMKYKIYYGSENVDCPRNLYLCDSHFKNLMEGKFTFGEDNNAE